MTERARRDLQGELRAVHTTGLDDALNVARNLMNGAKSEAARVSALKAYTDLLKRADSEDQRRDIPEELALFMAEVVPDGQSAQRVAQ